MIYAISFYDPGVRCPYTVTLGTTVPLAKYGGAELQKQFLQQLLRKDDSAWQGATWMTEIEGGSDFGRRCKNNCAARNVGAELAVVAARP